MKRALPPIAVIVLAACDAETAMGPAARTVTAQIARPSDGPCATAELAISWLRAPEQRIGPRARLGLLAERSIWSTGDRVRLDLPSEPVRVYAMRGAPDILPHTVPTLGPCAGAVTVATELNEVSLQVRELGDELTAADELSLCEVAGGTRTLLHVSVGGTHQVGGCVARGLDATRTLVVLGTVDIREMARPTNLILVSNPRWLDGRLREDVLREVSQLDVLDGEDMVVAAEGAWAGMAVEILRRTGGRRLALSQPFALDPDVDLDLGQVADPSVARVELFGARLGAGSSWGLWAHAMGEAPPFSHTGSIDEAAWARWRARAPVRWLESHASELVVSTWPGDMDPIARRLGDAGATIVVQAAHDKIDELFDVQP